MKLVVTLAAALATAGLFAEKPWVDFDKKIGDIRPELHSSGFGPTVNAMTEETLESLKSMHFKSARTHDWALVNPNQRVCDWQHIFPLVNLDATKPENYVFAQTDYLLKRTREEMGCDIFFRLGTSIEHSGPKVHFNSLIPEDFDKVAEVFAGTVRHYNRGWANGHKWDIKYWEIWNEPDGFNNMFCLPEGDGGDGSEAAIKANDLKRRELFAKLFVKCLKRLKGEFGDEIKVGGPALCSLSPARVEYFRYLLQACKEAGVVPDFVSWHGYTNNPWQFNTEALTMRKLCDEFGFTKCELIVNEWHYFGSNYSWQDLQLCSDPLVKARIWDGPDGHNAIRSSCFTLATLANLQDSKLDQAFYYGCSHVGYWGFKDPLQNKFKVFYALQMFGKIVSEYSDRCAYYSKDTITAFPVKSKDGRKALMVVDYGGADRNIKIDVKGVAADSKLKVTLLDHAHNLTPLETKFCGFKDGTLSLTKPDFFSAAFLVEFE